MDCPLLHRRLLPNVLLNLAHRLTYYWILLCSFRAYVNHPFSLLPSCLPYPMLPSLCMCLNLLKKHLLIRKAIILHSFLETQPSASLFTVLHERRTVSFLWEVGKEKTNCLSPAALWVWPTSWCSCAGFVNQRMWRVCPALGSMVSGLNVNVPIQPSCCEWEL